MVGVYGEQGGIINSAKEGEMGCINEVTHPILSTVRAFFNDDDLSEAGRVG